MPLNALANDNWLGREKPYLRDTTEATRMLSCLGRPLIKQVRLGRAERSCQQTGIAGNTILLAQPSAKIPSMELPPPADGLADHFNVVFPGQHMDLARGRWATVNRDTCTSSPNE